MSLIRPGQIRLLLTKVIIVNMGEIIAGSLMNIYYLLRCVAQRSLAIMKQFESI